MRAIAQRHKERIVQRRQRQADSQVLHQTQTDRNTRFDHGAAEIRHGTLNREFTHEIRLLGDGRRQRARLNRRDRIIDRVKADKGDTSPTSGCGRFDRAEDHFVVVREHRIDFGIVGLQEVLEHRQDLRHG